MIRIAIAIAALATLAAPAIADPVPALEHTLATEGWSARVLDALGTAYATGGHPGRAILAYERAHLLAPRDATIRAELARTEESAGLAITPQPRLEAALGTLSSDEWTWIALAGGALACAGAAAFAWSVRRRAAGFAIVVGVVCVGLASAAAVEVAPSPSVAIVVRGDLARIAPFETAEAAFTAPEGEQVEIEQEHGDFVYVRDGERTGWLPHAAVERLEPPAAHT